MVDTFNIYLVVCKWACGQQCNTHPTKEVAGSEQFSQTHVPLCHLFQSMTKKTHYRYRVTYIIHHSQRDFLILNSNTTTTKTKYRTIDSYMQIKMESMRVEERNFYYSLALHQSCSVIYSGGGLFKCKLTALTSIILYRTIIQQIINIFAYMYQKEPTTLGLIKKMTSLAQVYIIICASLYHDIYIRKMGTNHKPASQSKHLRNQHGINQQCFAIHDMSSP